jgi:hypothetical protein
MNIDGIDYPDNWSVSGTPTDWHLYRNGKLIYRGTSQAFVLRCPSKEEWLSTIPDADHFVELYFQGEVNQGISFEDHRLWRDECPQRTHDILGYTGSLGYFIAFHVGGVQHVPGAPWPPPADPDDD